MSDNDISISNTAKVFFCGGVAGCCAKTTVAPLDRVKILLQAHNRAFESKGVRHTLGAVWQTEGALGFYRGNGVQMLRIFPYSAIQFLSFDSYSKLLVAYYGHTKVTHLISGSMAGVTAVAVTYPLDVVRSRLAFQRTGSIAYSGIVDCLRQMRAEQSGIRPFFVGFLPSLVGMVPYAGISFYAFDALKRTALLRCPNWFGALDSDGELRLSTVARLIIGGLAGALAQTVSYPLDSTRRTMQVAVMRHEAAELACRQQSAGMLSTLADLYANYGVAQGLYRGLTINYVRVVPMAAVSFTAYETLKQATGAR